MSDIENVDEVPVDQPKSAPEDRATAGPFDESEANPVRPYVDLGFNHLVFHGPGEDQSRFLTSFADQVLPGLRELG